MHAEVTVANAEVTVANAEVTVANAIAMSCGVLRAYSKPLAKEV